MTVWLSEYSDALGMCPASIITTIFGAFCVSFVVAICWPKLVEDFGPAGGMLAAAFIIGTFWVLNHKLPGFGINPEFIKDGSGQVRQFGLIYQGFRGASPWVDMGWSIAMGLWICGLIEAHRGQRLALAAESIPRGAFVFAGGAVGGAITALVRFSDAPLFGY
jgi:hypothetical protein